MFSNTISLSTQIIGGSIISFLMSFIMLGCSQKTESGSPMQQELEPVQMPTASQNGSILPEGKYMFVEIWLAFDGTGVLPMKFIDFPGYGYDAATGELKSYGRGRQAALAPTDWGFIGLGEKRSGSMGGGVSSQLVTIDQLPFTVSAPIFAGKLSEFAVEVNHIPITLLSISANGEVVINMNGKQLTLPRGEKWEQVQDITVNTERFNGHLWVTFSIINYAWNARDLIDGK
jgi:hypothetical protein